MAKSAVLIGVNRYRIPGADLRGCVPDVKNMSSLLQRKYGFDAGDISMLTDFDATKKAIEEAITGLSAAGNVAMCFSCTSPATAPTSPTTTATRPTTATRSSVRPISTGMTHCATTGCAVSSTGSVTG